MKCFRNSTAINGNASLVRGRGVALGLPLPPAPIRALGFDEKTLRWTSGGGTLCRVITQRLPAGHLDPADASPHRGAGPRPRLPLARVGLSTWRLPGACCLDRHPRLRSPLHLRAVNRILGSSQRKPGTLYIQGCLLFTFKVTLGYGNSLISLL